MAAWNIAAGDGSGCDDDGCDVDDDCDCDFDSGCDDGANVAEAAAAAAVGGGDDDCGNSWLIPFYTKMLLLLLRLVFLFFKFDALFYLSLGDWNISVFLEIVAKKISQKIIYHKCCTTTNDNGLLGSIELLFHTHTPKRSERAQIYRLFGWLFPFSC